MELSKVRLTRKDWESDFFNKEIYKAELPTGVGGIELRKQLLLGFQNIGFELVEANLDTAELVNAEVLEDLGFRLVDSRATFITRIEITSEKHTFKNIYPEYEITSFEANDEAAIIALNEAFVINNDGLVSRYKNTRYFAPGDKNRYFQRWIKYCLQKETTHIAVARFDGATIGFFIFEDRGTYLDLPLYKGILAAIDRPHQGKKLHLAMQSYLFKNFGPKQFYLDNTTQLSNYPILKNHVRSKRRIHQFSLTFMLQRTEFNG